MPGLSQDLGISSGGIADGPARRAVECLLAIAMYNFVELVVIIQTAFQRRQGLYYWSFVVATWGIAVYAVGFLTKDLALIRNGAVYATFIFVGWACMVTGQSMVLWSRMHLLVRNKTTLRSILLMIIVDAVIGHVPTSVVLYGSNSAHPDKWLDPYAILERFHVTLFLVQELAISTVYIVETTKLLRTKPCLARRPSILARAKPCAPSSRRAQTAESGRQFLMRLIYINLLVVFLDITIVALQYAGLYVIQTAYKAMVYSVKLKLEFSILNSLVTMTRRHRAARADDVFDSPFSPSVYGSSHESSFWSLSLSSHHHHYQRGKQRRQHHQQQQQQQQPAMALPLFATRQAHTPVTFSRLTQTIDEDGQIRYTGSSRMDNDGDLCQTTHSRPESVYNPTHARGTPGTCTGHEAAEDADTLADAATQFVIRRDRREDWEDKSDLDELVLEGGKQSLLAD